MRDTAQPHLANQRHRRSANLCVESHLRDLVEQGFEVAVVKDATAAANHPELGGGCAAALTNFAFIASDVRETDADIKELWFADSPDFLLRHLRS